VDPVSPRTSGAREPLALSYLLPLKAEALDCDLATYLRALVTEVDDLIVIDSSPAHVFRSHAAAWDRGVHHLPPEDELPMGKVANVRTGLRHARHDRVVIADDDVRWTRDGLAQVIDALDRAEVVRPANHFEPERWHTRWDTGRALLARATGGDWPGTLAVRRSALPPSGYAGDCLFENLELVRTVRARGGRELVRHDLLVPRRPPTTRKFLEQRTRQAYDELARPIRLVLQLAIAPALLRWRGRAVVPVAAGAIGLAALGRRREGGERVWSRTAPLWAPLWVFERGITSWIALLHWATGGARVGGRRVPRAAHREQELRDRSRSDAAARTWAGAGRGPTPTGARGELQRTEVSS
jgi:hypothetical protein